MKLEKCFNCGRSASMKSANDEYGKPIVFCVCCDFCPCFGNAKGTEAEALEEWNNLGVEAKSFELIKAAVSLDKKSWENLFKTVLESSTSALVKALETMVILNSEYPIENLKAAIFSARREGLDAKTVKSYEMDVWRAEQKLIAVEAVQNEKPEPDEEEIQDAKDALGKAYGILKGGVK